MAPNRRRRFRESEMGRRKAISKNIRETVQQGSMRSTLQYNEDQFTRILAFSRGIIYSTKDSQRFYWSFGEKIFNQSILNANQYNQHGTNTMDLIAIKMFGPILFLCRDILMAYKEIILQYNRDQCDYIAHLEDSEVFKLLPSMELLLHEESFMMKVAASMPSCKRRENTLMS